MSWLIPLGLGGLAIALMAIFTALASRKGQAAHVAPATLVGASVLLHDINDDRCTGCDACVAVCPTNVLELIDNKSRVVRFEDCIQCEACMFACPTEALVMFPEGTVPPPLRLPEMDEFFQTATPGQYLIGEVAGKPLVKNAANLGRMVIEHMVGFGLRASQAPTPPAGVHSVDVVIVGSGPSGLSAAITCIQRGLSYVVLEKEQIIASTIARYPKGKLVMAEPYECENLSLLPVFDSSKEQLLPIWEELISRLNVRVRLGESVESVTHNGTTFDVKTTVAAYQAQRCVLAIGTRGKPRTLQVPGENLAKVSSMLEDPADWQGKAVLVVGGGDSAVEAALALADAGAKVIVSYRGNSFARCAPKNKQTIEAYAKEGRIKAKLGSTVVSLADDNVVLQFPDGSQKQYVNHGAFVLIGADPPVAWLEKMGVRFVEREHQYQLGRSDDLLRRFVPNAMACAEDAARAAAAVLGGAVDMPARRKPTAATPERTEHSVARKWFRAATNMLTGAERPTTNAGQGRAATAGLAKRRASTNFGAQSTQSGIPRDQLSTSERTRILRMLRDEGGRIADEESQVGVPSLQARFDLPDDDSPIPELRAQAVMQYGSSSPAKEAVVEGLAEAQARSRRGPVPAAPSGLRPPPPASRRQHADQFREEETRQVDAEMLAQLRMTMPAEATQISAAPRPPVASMPTLITGFEDNEATVMSTPFGVRDDRPRPPLPSRPTPRHSGPNSEAPLTEVDWDLD